MKKVKIKEWYKEHKQEVRDFCWYAAGFGAALVSLKIAEKITYTGKSCTSFWNNENGDFAIRCGRERRFGKGFDYAGTLYQKDDLDHVVECFNTMVDGVRKTNQ